MRITILRSLCLIVAANIFSFAAAADDDTERLIAALLGDTPIIDDLHELTDNIGGRPTGNAANRAAIAWGVTKFRQAEVAVSTEDFEMPVLWEEKHVSASISGAASFDANVVAKPFSAAADALSTALLDAGFGTEADFARLGKQSRGAWVLVETPILDDAAGLGRLLAEYGDSYQVESRASNADVAGVVFMSSRPKNLLYRHNASTNRHNKLPLLVMEREHAKRALRLLRSGHDLTFSGTIEVDLGPSFTSSNVVAEIPGSKHPEEIVLFGAHLDSHNLGTGALDNGVNVVMLINIARQITRLGLQPDRTIRFVLWNGEEENFVGSRSYTEQHEHELDNHIVAASLDTGSGRTSGFLTGGRPELVALVDKYLAPVAGLGPFQQHDIAIVGTDNFDFMLEGVANLIAAQADANYASNYHAESDTFDKVDQHQLRLNSAISAAVLWGFANDTARLPRQSHGEVQTLIDSTDLEQAMKNMAVWDDWADGTRGRHD